MLKITSPKNNEGGVIAVSLDMGKTYVSAILECFPKASPVIDRFHISQAFHVAVDKARKHIQNKIRKEDLTPKEDNLLQQVCNQYPLLNTCYELKEEFRTFFTITNIDEASTYIDYFTAIVAESAIPELQSFCKTLNNWREYILNYYYFFISNGSTEDRNHKLKNIKRRGWSYRNIFNFRLRVISECC